MRMGVGRVFLVFITRISNSQTVCLSVLSEDLPKPNVRKSAIDIVKFAYARKYNRVYN
jgi:hypothetical protein